MEVKTRTLEILGIEADVPEIRPDNSFEEIGIDSVQFVKIVVKLEVEFAVEFDDDHLILSEYTSVQELIDYIIWLSEQDGEES